MRLAPRPPHQVDLRSTTVQLFAIAGFFVGLTAPSEAASLQQVSNWGVTGLPSDVTMFVYVPDRVATNPPILTLIHYCGGTASAVFGQAQGGGVVSAADQYGFIMVVPSSGRCWDVESDKAWTRNGGGDSHAIKQMVTYAVGKYSANADRIYSTGDSSGAMMTELLLALYPDIFKAGAAFAGMPAGCRGTNESGTSMGYSGACAGGAVMHTAQEWGDIARKMDPGYTGHRPRVQLFHGDADPTIRYQNFTEAIKEWTNVLGLAAAPTSTAMGVQLGNHQATRQQWLNGCGYLVLDGFTSIGGDHGPSDALFKAQYVIPFLGLDKTGAMDPELQQCGSDGGAGGGFGADGGIDAGGRGGAAGDAGGRGGAAGGRGGGDAGAAGSSGAGGTASGGNGGAGPAGRGGGGLGGTLGTGGTTMATGGSGASGAGGGSAGSGNGGNAAAGSSIAGAGGNAGSITGDSGCSCAVVVTASGSHAYFVPAIAALIALVGLARRRRARRG
jgi:poly(hydroxyalkanoate) depolymerase family esterase